MGIEELEARYLALFGRNAAEPSELMALENLLHIRFPEDFRRIASFYCGGLLGRLSFNSYSSVGPASNIGESTLRFRDGGLPGTMVVLAELDESVIVMDTALDASAAIIWCDNYDFVNVVMGGVLESADTWPTFEDFFASLITDEEDERSRVGGSA